MGTTSYHKRHFVSDHGLSMENAIFLLGKVFITTTLVQEQHLVPDSPVSPSANPNLLLND